VRVQVQRYVAAQMEHGTDETRRATTMGHSYWVMARKKWTLACSTRRCVSSQVHRVSWAVRKSMASYEKHSSTHEDVRSFAGIKILTYTFDTTNIILGRKIAEPCSLHARVLLHVGLNTVSALLLGQERHTSHANSTAHGPW